MSLVDSTFLTLSSVFSFLDLFKYNKDTQIKITEITEIDLHNFHLVELKDLISKKMM